MILIYANLQEQISKLYLNAREIGSKRGFFDHRMALI